VKNFARTSHESFRQSTCGSCRFGNLWGRFAAMGRGARTNGSWHPQRTPRRRHRDPGVLLGFTGRRRIPGGPARKRASDYEHSIAGCERQPSLRRLVAWSHAIVSRWPDRRCRAVAAARPRASCAGGGGGACCHDRRPRGRHPIDERPTLDCRPRARAAAGVGAPRAGDPGQHHAAHMLPSRRWVTQCRARLGELRMLAASTTRCARLRGVRRVGEGQATARA